MRAKIVVLFFSINLLAWAGGEYNRYVNRELIAAYHEEYKSGGSMKFRTPDGNAYQSKATWLNITYILSGLIYIYQLLRTKFWLMKGLSKQFYSISLVIVLGVFIGSF